jgi:hypothetical protein
VNVHDAIMLGFLLFIAGAVFGVAGAIALRDGLREVERNRHQKTMAEQAQEITRLRTQVALHIGKERT